MPPAASAEIPVSALVPNEVARANAPPRGEERIGAASWDRHIDLLMATNPSWRLSNTSNAGMIRVE
jgi:hypothetical protein